MLRVVRTAILVVLVFLVLSLVIAFARPETGVFEKVVLVAAVVGLVALAAPVKANRNESLSPAGLPAQYVPRVALVGPLREPSRTS